MKKFSFVLSLMIIYTGHFAKSNSSESDNVLEAMSEPTPLLVSNTGSKSTSSFSDPYSFFIRTNLLYDAVMLPTIGIEWRISQDYGIKLDGSWSNWGSENDKIQKMWVLSPEFRYYLGDAKCFYTGIGLNFGHANLYQYILGKMIKDDRGYDGNFYGVGLVAGYQLLLTNKLSIDFNIGLGYTRFSYDNYFIENNQRVYVDLDFWENRWGPTQAGISLVWKISGN